MVVVSILFPDENPRPIQGYSRILFAFLWIQSDLDTNTVYLRLSRLIFEIANLASHSTTELDGVF